MLGEFWREGSPWRNDQRSARDTRHNGPTKTLHQETAGTLSLSLSLTHHLHRAVRDRDLEALRDRIARGDDVNGRDGVGRTPLISACHYAQHECARALIEANASVDNNGLTPLMRASHWGQQKCARALIDAGAAVDIVNYGGKTALVLACNFGSYECTRALIDAQADLELTNRDGQNALMIACESSPARAQPPTYYTPSRRLGRIRCALALLEATAPIQEADFPDRAASLKFAGERLQLIEFLLAMKHINEDAPLLASMEARKADMQGVFVNFARDMPGLQFAKLPKPRRRSRRLAAKR